MGRIKTSFVKHFGREIYEQHAERFTDDFEKNKKVVDEFAWFKSKKMRNILAGYVTALKKQQRG